jgi:hypothetical protein
MPRTRPVRTVLVPLVLLAPVLVVGGTASPSYASSQVCETPELATLLGQDCTAPTARIYSKKAAPNGGLSLDEGEETTSGFVEFYMSATTEDPQDDLDGDDDSDEVTFSCRLERNGSVVAGQDWQDCTEDDPFDTYDYARGNIRYGDEEAGDAPLQPGTYTFSVRASDAAVDKLLLGSSAPNEQEEPTTFSWKVVEPTNDTTPPNTSFTSTPRRWHLSPFVAEEYAGNEPLKDAVCRLQGNLISACDRSQATMRVSAGDWRFTVAGIDIAGNQDPTPAVNQFTVPVPSAKLRASGGWNRGSGSAYFFSGYSTTKKKGASLSAARPGTRSVALVATKCPGCGTVKVSYGSKVLKKVSLAASSRRTRQLVPIVSWASGHGGRVTVTVISSGKPVTIEGLGFSKRR